MSSKPLGSDYPSDHLVMIGNMLDALDRLFDRESSVIDVYALLFATSIAMKDSPCFEAIDGPLDPLRSIVQSKETTEEKRGSALCATNELRICLAAIDRTTWT